MNKIKVILPNEVISFCKIENLKENEEGLIDYKEINKKRIRHLKIIAFCSECEEKKEITISNFVLNCRRNDSFLCKKCALLKKYGVTNITYVPEVREKTRKTNLEKYGYITPSKNEKVSEKRKNTCLEKYCCECCLSDKNVRKKRNKTCLNKYGKEEPLSSEEIKEKIKNTVLEKYGVPYVAMNKEVQNKQHITNLYKYGSEYIGGSEEIKEKIKNTLLERYGVDNPILFPKFKEKAMESRLKNSNDIFFNGIPTSKQQIYFWNIYGGEINKLVNGYFVDILLENNIYFEYDGSGHDLSIKLKQTTEEKFNKREEKRRKILEDLNFKEFRIISNTDVLPNKDFLINLKNIAFFYFDNGYKHFIYNLETKEIIIK